MQTHGYCYIANYFSYFSNTLIVFALYYTQPYQLVTEEYPSLFSKTMPLQQDFQVILIATYKKPVSCKTAAFQYLQLLYL